MRTPSDIIIEALNGLVPRVALVLGSGLGGLVETVDNAVHVSYAKLAGFPESGVSGHAGEVVAGSIGGTPVLLLSGRVHYYEKGNPAAMRPVLEVLQGLGIEKLIAGGYTECTLPINGSLADMQFQQRLQENLDKLDVYCDQVTVAASPDQQTHTATVPAMKPLPAD